MSKRIFYHVAFWVAYVLYKSYLNFDPGASGEKSSIGFFMTLVLIQLVFVAIKMPLVYALFYVTNRYLSKQWSFFKTISIVIIAFTVALFCFLIANQVIVNQEILNQKADLRTSITSLQSISYCFFVLAFVCGIAISIKLIRLNIKQKIAEQELLKKKLEIELQFLKAQSNPHFLFNTLNNIYGLARKNSDKTADVVLKLSNMLRYMLYETANKSNTVVNEIQIIKDYIELEKLRYTNRLQVIFKHSIDNYSEKLPPLLLLPFVENAFKHGAGESRFESYIEINLTLKDMQLHYEIKNSKEEIMTDDQDKIGLRNIKRQLELIYPNHNLTIDHDAKEFIVKLEINLNDGKL